MERAEFQERLLQTMERKHHWAWPLFRAGRVPLSLLHHHMEQEYAVYVRDFPVLVGWAYVQCPVPEVRQELAENIYEEETGGLSGGRPHPELFMEYPRGLGMDLARYDSIELLPPSRAYRDTLDRLVRDTGWAAAVAVTTIFIEGTPYDRSVLDPASPPRPEPPLEEHPLVMHYGLKVEHLALTKAHRAVEGGHREAAWRMVLGHTPERERERVCAAMEEALQAWLAYRDGVALVCGLEKGAP